MTSEAGDRRSTGESVSGRQTAARFFNALAVELGERIMRTEERMGAPGAMIPAVDRKGVNSGEYQSQKNLFYDFAKGIEANDDETIQEARAYLEKEMQKIKAKSKRLELRLAERLPDDDKFGDYEDEVADLKKAAYSATGNEKYRIEVSLSLAKGRLLSTKRFKLQQKLAGLASKAGEYAEVLREL